MVRAERGRLARIEATCGRVLRAVEPESHMEGVRRRHEGSARPRAWNRIGIETKNPIQQNALHHRFRFAIGAYVNIRLVPCQAERTIEIGVEITGGIEIA